MTKIRVSIPFVCLVALMYIFDCRNVFLPTFIAVALHEFSHIAAARVCGGTIDFVDIRAFGIKVNIPELSMMSYGKEIIIAAAGPAAGIITAVSAVAAARILKTDSFSYFIGVNALITAINLIPVYPLDGGRIALSLNLMIFSMRTAYFISYVLSLVSIATLFAICTYLAINGMLNPSLVIFSVYITACGIKFLNAF
ncbi:MAG: hypothetical protein IJN71_06350 [Oscillospiraceae bacterium]|nr:hypothetical protein [Oscillospiraceae bacterium]